MMKRTFLIGVAAGALLAGANIMASAQGMNQQQQPGASSGGMERGGVGPPRIPALPRRPRNGHVDLLPRHDADR